MALLSGARLGPYEILAPLGQGGMGEVYKARDTRLDRTVAIKVLPAALAADPQFRERFDREARTISSLDHPHICALYDVGEAPNPQSQIPNPVPIRFLVMQYLEGETLADRLARGARRAPAAAATSESASRGAAASGSLEPKAPGVGPRRREDGGAPRALSLDQALQDAIQIASALDTAHRAAVTHRDLKPGNVMLTKAGAKVLDFVAPRRKLGRVGRIGPVGRAGSPRCPRNPC